MIDNRVDDIVFSLKDKLMKESYCFIDIYEDC